MPASARMKLKSSSGSPSKSKASMKSKRGAVSAKRATFQKNQTSDDEDDRGDAYETSDAEELHSDALDSDDGAPSSTKKRKRSGQKKASSTPKKRGRKDEDGAESDDDLLDGQTVVGRVVEAPREGRVPPGQISQNTFDFLKQLAKPECNDREWFKLHEPVYRQAEKEWNAWIEAFTLLLAEVDDQIPILPSKDVIHRIYRDVRFSNDKTPYKKGFSASFSRSGRKGIFAHYHVASVYNMLTMAAPLYLTERYQFLVIPGGKSLIAAGAWQPGRNELATMRNHIKRNPSRFRDIISDPEFVTFFGEPFPHPKRERQNVFGHEDELKVAPKGIDKNHSDIDLLKLRSVAVVHNFLDSEVTASDFKENICKVISVMKPLVHCLNDMMTLPVEEDDDDDDEDDG